jgi:hypothetical protein
MVPLSDGSVQICDEIESPYEDPVSLCDVSVSLCEEFVSLFADLSASVIWIIAFVAEVAKVAVLFS